MPGRVVRILPKSNYTLADSTVTHRVAQHVDVTDAETARVLCRVHAMAANLASDVKLEVYADGHTPLDPDADFVSASAFATVELGALSAGDFRVSQLTQGFGDKLLFELTLTETGTPIDADISIDLAVRW